MTIEIVCRRWHDFSLILANFLRLFLARFLFSSSNPQSSGVSAFCTRYGEDAEKRKRQSNAKLLVPEDQLPHAANKAVKTAMFWGTLNYQNATNGCVCFPDFQYIDGRLSNAPFQNTYLPFAHLFTLTLTTPSDVFFSAACVCSSSLCYSEYEYDIRLFSRRQL